jgi:glutathione synthase/RimK-type ligase-like ATP-grasp enzyme
MILLFGALSDSAIAYVAHRLMEAKARFLLLDPRQIGTGFELEWEVDGGGIGGQVRHDGQVTPLAEVQSVYVHLLSLPRTKSSTEQDRPAAVSEAAAHWLVHNFLETIPVPVCNRPSAMATNYSKTWQQQIIAAHGFRVPRTLTTNVPEEARRFYDDCRRRVIYKSLSARRSIVKRLKAADLRRLERVRACPTQFQEWVPGTDIRVHVIGRRLFPTEIVTDAVDYRYSGRDGLPRAMRGTELPDEVGARCLDLAASLGLVTAGVDLRRGLDGQYYCFEVNPTPGFMFYQQYTGQRIGDALVDLLVGRS